MNARHEIKLNLIHFFGFCAFGVCTPLHCTQNVTQDYRVAIVFRSNVPVTQISTGLNIRHLF